MIVVTVLVAPRTAKEDMSGSVSASASVNGSPRKIVNVLTHALAHVRAMIAVIDAMRIENRFLLLMRGKVCFYFPHCSPCAQYTFFSVMILTFLQSRLSRLLLPQLMMTLIPPSKHTPRGHMFFLALRHCLVFCQAPITFSNAKTISAAICIPLADLSNSRKKNKTPFLYSTWFIKTSVRVIHSYSQYFPVFCFFSPFCLHRRYN